MAKKKQAPEQVLQSDQVAQAEHFGPVLAKRQAMIAPNQVTMYANGFQIAIGQLDVRLLVMETFPINPGEVVDKQIASIIMTPETLKVLANSIGNFVKAYEDNFGKIRDFPNAQGPTQTINVPHQKWGTKSD